MSAKFELFCCTALVTSASRGIGKVIAVGLADAGAEIILASRDMNELEVICEQLRAGGSRGYYFKVDVSNFESIEHLYDAMDAENLLADILVNYAGVVQVFPSLDVDEALWEKSFPTI